MNPLILLICVIRGYFNPSHTCQRVRRDHYLILNLDKMKDLITNTSEIEEVANVKKIDNENKNFFKSQQPLRISVHASERFFFKRYNISFLENSSKVILRFISKPITSLHIIQYTRTRSQECLAKILSVSGINTWRTA